MYTFSHIHKKLLDLQSSNGCLVLRKIFPEKLISPFSLLDLQWKIMVENSFPFNYRHLPHYIITNISISPILAWSICIKPNNRKLISPKDWKIRHNLNLLPTIFIKYYPFKKVLSSCSHNWKLKLQRWDKSNLNIN